MPFFPRQRRPRCSLEKGFKCAYPHCEKTFFYKKHVRRHQKEKHSEWFEKVRGAHGLMEPDTELEENAEDVKCEDQHEGGTWM